jgi:hypothetical protein
MRRSYLVAAVGGLVLVAVLVTRYGSPSSAQDVPKDKPETKKPAATALPIAQVVLFNSGVGYFQREGQVDGETRVDLSFPIGDINDLLKSLVLQDMGNGNINAVSYDSQDPLDKILHSFALDLNNNPTFGQILNQARGERIEVLHQLKKDGAASKLSGTIVGMEVKRVPAGKDSFVDVDQLNLLGPEGLQSLPLTQVLAVRFLNPVLDNEFKRALQVLAGSHDVQKKAVSLAFHGDGKRQVRIGYVVERPIWKTSYRLLLGQNGNLFLQGWAMVENTSDDDWNNVRMVLVSGRPISFQMNLYDPLYIPRPTVEPELFASLRPPVYGGAMMAGEKGINPVQAGGPAAPPGFAGGQGGAVNLGGAPGRGYAAGQLGVAPNPYQLANNYFNLLRPEMGFQGGFQGQIQNNDLANFGNNAMLNQRLTYEQLQKRREEQNRNKDQAKRAGATIAGLNFKEGIASVASAEEIGDYYRYVLDQKITLSRQKSAMLPILNQNIRGSKLSIFNESVHAKYPLLGLRLKNTSGQPLTQGPITVYEDGSYAGDTRILDLQPDEERLLSYAMDLGMEVKAQTHTTPSPTMNFKIGADALTARYKLRETKTYTVKNRSQSPRTLIIEHPIRGDWSLIDPKQPAERTREVYRFHVMVPPGNTVTQEVVEEQARIDQLALAAPAKDTPPRYAIGLGIDVKPEVKTSPEELVDLKIAKGVLNALYRIRESKTYFIQNLSGEKREFVIDHVVRPEWKLRSPEGDQDMVGPAVYRFKLEVPAGKTSHRQLLEAHTRLDKSKAVKAAPETLLREFLASSAPSAEVKAALTKTLDLSAKLAEARRQLAEITSQLEALTRDQTRLRENLRIIPQSSEQFKTFLQKFVTQETSIETLQRQERQLQASAQQQQRELDLYVANLTVE